MDTQPNERAPSNSGGVTAPELHYPFERTRDVGFIREIADDVLWLRVPLPFAPFSLNVWTLRDDDGWVVVDTGSIMPEAFDCWRRIEEYLRPRGGLSKILVTHAHPDHFGLAGWLCDEFGLTLMMSREEWYLARLFYTEDAELRRKRNKNYFLWAGVPGELTPDLMHGDKNFEKTTPIPPSFFRLHPGTEIRIGAHLWQIIGGQGHSAEQVSLYDADRNLILTGDHILPRIVPPIWVPFHEPEDDPVGDYIATMGNFSHVAEDAMVLPAHGSPFIGLEKQIAMVHDHFNARFDRLMELVDEPATIYDLGIAIGPPKDGRLFFHLTGLHAELNALVTRGELKRTVRDNRWIFEKA